VAVLFVPAEGFGQLNPIGIGLCLAGAISWAIGSLYARHHPLPRSALLGTGMEMLIGGMALFVGGVLLGELGQTQIDEFSLRSIVAVLYLIVFGSIAGYSAYTWLLANVSVSTVATYAYVNPIVAVALGAIFLAEPITPRTLIAAVLIIGAVIAMVSGRPRASEEPARQIEGAVEPDGA
jgi:drug/metabolite transporter (DMT)-like permease